MFAKYDDLGNVERYTEAVIDCQKAVENGEEILTEQSHKEEVDINNIISRHGVELIQKTALLASKEFQFDDVTGNDFQEAMYKVAKAQQTFDSMPSQIRNKFQNNPAVFLDYVQNPDNKQALYDMGLAVPPPPPATVKVEVTNETLATTTTTPVEGTT